jgi:hypothetical protein
VLPCTSQEQNVKPPSVLPGDFGLPDQVVEGKAILTEPRVLHKTTLFLKFRTGIVSNLQEKHPRSAGHA